MDLDISELDFEGDFNNFEEEEVEDIPENIIPKPIIKNVNNVKKPNKVQFVIDKPEVKPPMSYDDILNKMGMFVAEGKLHLMDNLNTKQQKQILQQNQNQNRVEVEQVPLTKQNTYIHNKYFNNDVKETPAVRVPKNVYEYRNMLINDILQRQKIKQLKSTKLFLPDTNIHFAPNSNANLNKLFNFSLR
jgi:hypothetical protein